jgi:hypothetical protein
MHPSKALTPLSASPFRPHLQPTKDACDGLIKLIARWRYCHYYTVIINKTVNSTHLSLAESNAKPFLLTFTRGEAASKAETFSANRDRETTHHGREDANARSEAPLVMVVLTQLQRGGVEDPYRYRASNQE